MAKFWKDRLRVDHVYSMKIIFFYKRFILWTLAINETAGKGKGPTLFLSTTSNHSLEH